MFDWVREVSKTVKRGEVLRMALAFLSDAEWNQTRDNWGTTYESVASMGESVGLSRTSAHRAMKVLEGEGLILRVGCKRCERKGEDGCVGGRSGHPTIRACAIDGHRMDNPARRRTVKQTKQGPPCGHDRDAIRTDGTCRVCDALTQEH